MSVYLVDGNLSPFRSPAACNGYIHHFVRCFPEFEGPWVKKIHERAAARAAATFYAGRVNRVVIL